ncbi:MAG: TonB-dependent receptor [Micropepsaceae bacterium]
MSKKAIATSRLRAALLAGTAFTTYLAGGYTAVAQDASTKVEKVTVTGTRIKQPNTNNIVSTQTIGSARIEMSGEANVVDVLRDLPIVGIPGISSVNSNFITSQNGVNTLDLRELGANRTLVLINGRRVIAGVPLSQNVDFNAIPTEMIDRIDVLSGGSSAVYGSDAVAGVVNVILKKRFEGVTAKFQAGGNETYAEQDDYLASATMGANFADDRGNAILSVGYNHNGIAFAASRPGQEIDCLIGASVFSQNCGGFSSFAEGGVIRLSDTAGAASVDFVIDHVDGTTVRTRIGADGFNRQAQRLNLVPSDRYQFTGLVNFDILPRHSVFGEIGWTNTNSDSQIEPFALDSDDVYGFTEQVGALQGQPFGILPNNPYVPRQVLDLLGTRFGIVNPNLLARPALVAQLMAIPGAVIGFKHRLTELGNRGQDFNSSSARFAIGMEGQIGDWDYEIATTYGRTQQTQVGGGQINVGNLRRSLEAVDLNTDGDNNPATNPGDVVCADAISVAQGCVAINFFGPVRTPLPWTQQQVNWILAPVFRNQEQTQHVVSASATGALFENWAGEVEAAVGAEYRREAGADTTDALTRTGQNGGNIAPSTEGAFDVWEAYSEVKVPLFRDLPLMEEFNIHAAGRWSEYSTFGYTMAWSADAEWIVTPGVRLRGQLARAVRAPNIGELFTGASETFGVVVDPCNNLRTPAGGGNTLAGAPTNPTVIANCLLNPGILARANTPAGFVLSLAERQGTGGFQQGNPNLQPEKSDSQQFGIVLTPDFWGDWFGNLTMSADYFVVDIADAIAAVTRNQTLNLCYTSPGLGSPFCNQTAGGPVGWVRDVNGALVEVNTASGNVNALETNGFDVQLTYNFEVAELFGSSAEDDYGRMSLSGVWQHMNTNNQTSLAGTANASVLEFVDAVGVFSDELNLGAVYSYGDITLSWSSQWMGAANGVDEAGDIAPEEIPAQWFHDISGTYDVMENISIFGGVRNVANNYVFIGPGAFGATPTGWTTDPDTYDGLGRRFFLGVRVKM